MRTLTLGLWAALLLATLAQPAMAAADAVAASSDDDAVNPSFSFAEPAWRPVTSTDMLPWLSLEDYEYQPGRTSQWNQRFRAGSGSLGLDVAMRRYTTVTEDSFPYLHNGEAIVSRVGLRAAGVIVPGIEVSLEGGVGQLQFQPDGDTTYDRYNIGYHFGAGIAAAASLGTVGLLGIDLAFWSQEYRTTSGTNDAVVLNLGDEAAFLTYHFTASAYLYLELVGERRGLTLGLTVGAGYELLDGRLRTITRERFRLIGQQDLFGRAGLLLAVVQRFSLVADVTLARREGMGARLQLAWTFR